MLNTLSYSSSRAGRQIGLLGGSFNPAHEGHRYISLEAMKRLGLDQVWWLVSPANPLKDRKSLADYETRLALAEEAAHHPRIQISDIERRTGTRFTIDSLRRLKRKHPGVQFVWLMGADNLLTFHRWKDWRQIAREVSIVVIDRKPYTHQAIRSRAGVVLQKWRVAKTAPPPIGGRMGGGRSAMIRCLDDPIIRENFADHRMIGSSDDLSAPTPTLPLRGRGFFYLFLPPNHCSATILRKTLGKSAFLPHTVEGITAKETAYTSTIT